MIPRRLHSLYRILSSIIVGVFLTTSVIPPQTTYAQLLPQILNLPIPGTLIQTTSGFTPALIRGVTVNIENPLEFTFTIDTGNEQLDDNALRAKSTKLIKYFLASITVPKEELWVNLSPYEQNRIMGEHFGVTEMGRDLLAQDYMLKQLTASLIHPEKELGNAFWMRVRNKAFEQYGTTDIPFNTFNKVWIVPEEAEIFEHNTSAYVLSSHLKVMLEEDYLALEHHNKSNDRDTGHVVSATNKNPTTDHVTHSTKIIKEIIIPEIEREVNEGEIFANLRQIYNSMILAVWYKDNLQKSLLAQVYADKSKIKGVDSEDPNVKDKIYEQYLEAFKIGVYDMIREDYDPQTQSVVPRKYFSGGVGLPEARYRKITDAAQLSTENIQTLNGFSEGTTLDVTVELAGITPETSFERGAYYNASDAAMLRKSNEESPLLIPEDQIDTIIDFMLDGHRIPFDGRVYGNEEDADLYQLLARTLQLSGTVIDVGQGYNPYPSEGLLNSGVQEVIPINLEYEQEVPEELSEVDFVDMLLGIEDFGGPKQWFGFDAGGYEPWDISPKHNISAVIYNRSISYTSVYPKPTWRSPFSWRNIGDFARYFVWESWGHVQKSFRHAYNTLEPDGKIIILNGFNENIEQKFRASVTRLFRKKVEKELQKAGFTNIQIITKTNPDDKSRGLVLVIAQKPAVDAAMISSRSTYSIDTNVFNNTIYDELGNFYGEILGQMHTQQAQTEIHYISEEGALISTTIEDFLPDVAETPNFDVQKIIIRSSNSNVIIQKISNNFYSIETQFPDVKQERETLQIIKALFWIHTNGLSDIEKAYTDDSYAGDYPGKPLVVESNRFYELPAEEFNAYVINTLSEFIEALTNLLKPTNPKMKVVFNTKNDEAIIETSAEDFPKLAISFPNLDVIEIAMQFDNTTQITITKKEENQYEVNTSVSTLLQEREVLQIITNFFGKEHRPEINTDDFTLNYTYETDPDYPTDAAMIAAKREYAILPDTFNSKASNIDDLITVFELKHNLHFEDALLSFTDDQGNETILDYGMYRDRNIGSQQIHFIGIVLTFRNPEIAISLNKYHMDDRYAFEIDTKNGSKAQEKEIFLSLRRFFDIQSSDSEFSLDPTIEAAFSSESFTGPDAADAASLARELSRKVTELLHEVKKDQADIIRTRMLKLIDEQADDYDTREIKLWENLDTFNSETDNLAQELIKQISIYINTSIIFERTTDNKRMLILRLPIVQQERIRIITTLLNTFRMFRITEIEDPEPEVIKFSPATETRTKIIATLGPASDSEDTIRSLILDGTNVFRLNFSHINTSEQFEQTQRTIDTIRKISEELKRPVGILADLSGPKMRAEQTKVDIEISKGEMITLVPKLRANQTPVQGKHLTIDYPHLMTEIKAGEIVKINDGKVTLEVTAVNPETETIETRVVKGSVIPTSQGRKSVNFPKSKLSVSSITEKDKKDLLFILENNIGLIALSFVKTARDVQDLKVEIAKIKTNGTITTEDEYTKAKEGFDNRSRRPRIIAKIETPQALENIDEIIKEVDSLMVARGDLSVEVGKTDVPFHTEELIEKGQTSGKPVILATEVFDSLADPKVEREPSSGEIDAIYQTIRNRRPDAIMFSGETALGKNPNIAIQTADTVARNAEHDESQKRKWSKPTSKIQTGISSITGNIGVHISDVHAVFVFTRSGDSALEVARHRGSIPIVAISNVEESIPILTMTRGVHPVLINDQILPGNFGKYSIKLARELYKEQIEEAKKEGKHFYIGIQHGAGSTRQFLDSQPIEEAPGVSGQSNQVELYDLAAKNGADAAMIRSDEDTARLTAVIASLNEALNEEPRLSIGQAAERLGISTESIIESLRKIKSISFKKFRNDKITYKFKRKIISLRKRMEKNQSFIFEADIKPLYDLTGDWLRVKDALQIIGIDLQEIFADTLWTVFREDILLSNTDALQKAEIDFTGFNLKNFLDKMELDIDAVWFDAIVDIFMEYYTFGSSTTVKRHNGSILSFTYGEIWANKVKLQSGERHNGLTINDWVEHDNGSRIQVQKILLREGSLNHERAQALIGYDSSGFEHFFERHGTTFQRVINTVHTEIALSILRKNPNMPSTSIAGILSIERQTLSRQMEAVTGLSFVENREKIQAETDQAMVAAPLSKEYSSVNEIFSPLREEIRRVIVDEFAGIIPDNVEDQKRFARLTNAFLEEWKQTHGIEKLRNLEGLKDPQRPGPKEYERNAIDLDTDIGLSVVEHVIDGETPIHQHGNRFAFVIPLDEGLTETLYKHQIGIQANMAIYTPSTRVLQKGKIYAVTADYPAHKVQGTGKFLEIYITGESAKAEFERLTEVSYPEQILEGGLKLLDNEVILSTDYILSIEFPYKHRFLPALTPGWKALDRQEAVALLRESKAPILFQQTENALPPNVALENFTSGIWSNPIVYRYKDSSRLLLSSKPLRKTEVTNNNEMSHLQTMLINSEYFEQETDEDAAALAEPKENVGGIDLNPDMLNLKIHRDNTGMPLPLQQQPIFKMNIEGFLPVIINIQPVNIPVLLGLTNEKEATKIGYISQDRDKLSYNKKTYSRDPLEFAYRDN